ncbi:hypothetical protein TPB0596_12450 [Tsukamurella pulmonis]|uniref:hypothetical protein n=1 Tax=Tsukamurella pulmonis TaxID=47312 RepID=UPI001EE08C72|nr:hypothetical protein [Tsukamurella pulmonis]BDD81482.1 hypothetical protein TPB0596_12450 [Tsukamurella pulmonis]
MSTKIIEADDDVAAQAAELIAEHGAENVVTLSGGRGLQFAVTVHDEPAPKPAAKKPASTKTAATPAATES